MTTTTATGARRIAARRQRQAAAIPRLTPAEERLPPVGRMLCRLHRQEKVAFVLEYGERRAEILLRAKRASDEDRVRRGLMRRGFSLFPHEARTFVRMTTRARARARGRAPVRPRRRDLAARRRVDAEGDDDHDDGDGATLQLAGRGSGITRRVGTA